MRRAILCAALAASAFIGANSAAIAEDGEMRVRIGDLNLTSDYGAKLALLRIRHQSAIFCEVSPGRVGIDRVAASGKCQTMMVGKAVEQLNSRRVAALYRRGVPSEVTPVEMLLAAR